MTRVQTKNSPRLEIFIRQRTWVPWTLLFGLWSLVSIFAPERARAEDTCSYYKKYFPRLYDLSCSGGKARTGEAYSSFSDSFNMNPASIPTEPSPYGLETIVSYPRYEDPVYVPTFAIIKGFHKIGTAVSTGGNNTFYGNDVVQRGTAHTGDVDLAHPEPAEGYVSNLNVGTSYELGHFGGTQNISPTLGLSLRYNKITNTIGYGTGVGVSSGKVAIGLGVTREMISNTLPAMLFYSGVVAIKFPILEFEYTYLLNQGGYELGPIHIVTAAAVLGRVLLSAAARELNYYYLGNVFQTHFAMQFQVSRHLSLGYLLNYIPGTNSMATQIFL